MSNTYFKAMSVMGCEIGGITRRSLCRHNCCDGENCVTWLEKQFAKLNEYEEAKADGRLMVLPCKPNERWIGEQGEIVVIKIVTDWTGTYVHYRYKGKREVCCCNPTYFAIHFTREEAEAALRKEQSDER